jgi:hypothetical protein
MKAGYATVQEGMDHWLAGDHCLIDLGYVATFESPADGDVPRIWYQFA